MPSCPNCGKEYDLSAVFCSGCGKKIGKKKGSKLKYFILFFLALVVIGGGYYYYQYQQTVKAQQANNLYEIKLRVVVATMTESSAKAESMISQYSDVWQSAINRDSVYVNGKMAYGFDEAIQYKKEELSGDIANIETAKGEIDKQMKDLTNPPNKYKRAYDIAFELYGSYTNYVSLAQSPEGSLLTFNQKTGELRDEILKKIKEFEIAIPSK